MLNKEAFSKLIISPDQWYLPIYALLCMGLDSKKKKKRSAWCLGVCRDSVPAQEGEKLLGPPRGPLMWSS